MYSCVGTNYGQKSQLKATVSYSFIDKDNGLHDFMSFIFNIISGISSRWVGGNECPMTAEKISDVGNRFCTASSEGQRLVYWATGTRFINKRAKMTPTVVQKRRDNRDNQRDIFMFIRKHVVTPHSNRLLLMRRHNLWFMKKAANYPLVISVTPYLEQYSSLMILLHATSFLIRQTSETKHEEGEFKFCWRFCCIHFFINQ